MKMKKFAKIIGGAAVALSICPVAVSAGVVTIATGAQGSLAYNSGQAVAKVANEAGIVARTQPLVGYLPLINNGEVDFGFSNAVEIEFAASGTGNYSRDNKNCALSAPCFRSLPD